MIEMFRNNTMSFLLKVDTQGIEEMLKYIKTVSEKSEEYIQILYSGQEKKLTIKLDSDVDEMIIREDVVEMCMDEEELEYLKTVRRKEITEKIKVALGYGDLSENSEYDEAKNDQAFNEGRIIQLENMLKNAVVVDESEIPTDKVSVGSIVKVMDYEFDEEVEYAIVGSAEADPMNFKISNESPVGSALLGKKVGDVVEVTVPSGVSKFEILEIRRG